MFHKMFVYSWSTVEHVQMLIGGRTSEVWSTIGQTGELVETGNKSHNCFI